MHYINLVKSIYILYIYIKYTLYMNYNIHYISIYFVYSNRKIAYGADHPLTIEASKIVIKF